MATEPSGAKSLSPKQRAQLKALAHHLKPIHFIGKEGLSEATLGAIMEAFNHRELLKVKVQEASPVHARDAAPQLVERLPDVQHVQTIGRTLVLFRRHPIKPEIKLVR